MIIAAPKRKGPLAKVNLFKNTLMQGCRWGFSIIAAIANNASFAFYPLRKSGVRYEIPSILT